MRRRSFCLFVLACAAHALPARASVLESFNYPAGMNIVGLNGGTGFSGAFSAGGSAGTITGGNLSFAGLDAFGNKLTTNPGSNLIVRNLDASDSFTDGSTFYLSFMMRWDGSQASNWGGLQLIGNGPAQLFIGHPGSGITNYSIERAAADNTAMQSNVPVVAGQTALLVARVQLVNGNDTVRLYVDPTPDGPEPSTGSSPNLLGQDFGTISQVGISTSDAYSIDEIRIGLTYASVVPAPEPAAAGLVIIGACGLLARCRGALRK
jgi:hypothetical protein